MSESDPPPQPPEDLKKQDEDPVFPPKHELAAMLARPAVPLADIYSFFRPRVDPHGDIFTGTPVDVSSSDLPPIPSLILSGLPPVSTLLPEEGLLFAPKQGIESVPDIKLDPGLTKYATLKVSDKHGKSKYIVRGYHNPLWILVDPELPKGADHFIIGRVTAEMRLYNVDFEVVGWGRVDHDADRKRTTIYEEQLEIPEGFDGMSVQAFFLRRLMKLGRLSDGYTTTYVNSKEMPQPSDATPQPSTSRR